MLIHVQRVVFSVIKKDSKKQVNSTTFPITTSRTPNKDLRRMSYKNMYKNSNKNRQTMFVVLPILQGTVFFSQIKVSVFPTAPEGNVTLSDV